MALVSLFVVKSWCISLCVSDCSLSCTQAVGPQNLYPDAVRSACVLMYCSWGCVASPGLCMGGVQCMSAGMLLQDVHMGDTLPPHGGISLFEKRQIRKSLF